jgi:hypothetical protein
MLRTEMSGGASRLPSEQLLGREREREALDRLPRKAFRKLDAKSRTQLAHRLR